MPSFTDTAGRQWPIRLDVTTLRAVKTALQLDLLQVTAPGSDLLPRLMDDAVLLCDVLWVVCRPLAVDRQVTDEEFGRGLAGDVLDQAAEALLQSLVDFFPNGRRQVLQKALARIKKLQQRMETRALALLDSPDIDAQLDRVIAAAMTPGEPSTDSPAPPASIPAP